MRISSHLETVPAVDSSARLEVSSRDMAKGFGWRSVVMQIPNRLAVN